MHNINPPHKGAAALRRTKNGKRIPQNASPKPSKSWPYTNQGTDYHSGCGPNAQHIGPSTQVLAHQMRFPPSCRPPTSTNPSAANVPIALCSSEPPSNLLLGPSVPTSELILGPGAVQVILQDQRSISEMQFMLLASLNDGISFLHHQMQVAGSFALMPENRLHFILLLTIDHHGRSWSLLPVELPGSVEPFQV